MYVVAMTSTHLKFASIAVCLAFGLASCGDDGSKSNSTTADNDSDSDSGSGADDTTTATAAPDTTVSGGDDVVVKIEGGIMVDGAGMTLYTFANDPADTSTCNAGCVDTWPPLLTAASFTLQGDVDPTVFSVIVRDDGTKQVTYQGQPLYYYAGDSAPGDYNGDGIGGVWSTVVIFI